MRRCRMIQTMTIGLLVLGGALSSMSCGKGGGETERPADDTGPRIRVDRESIDFGDVVVAETVRAEVRLFNDGQAPLVIENMKVDCGCLTPTVAGRRLLPGESTTLEVGLLATAPIPLRKSVRIYTNDRYRPEAVVRILARGVRTTHVRPSKIDVTGVVPTTGKTFPVRIDVRDEEKIADVEIVRTWCPWLELRHRAGGGAGDFELQVRDVREAVMIEKQQLHATVVAEHVGTGKRRRIPVTLEVRGEVRPVASAIPSVLHYGAMATGDSRRRSVALKVPENWYLALSSAQQPRWKVEGGDGIDIQVRQSDDATEDEADDGIVELTFDVTWTPQAKGRILARVVFDWGEDHRVEIPVSGWAS